MHAYLLQLSRGGCNVVLVVLLSKLLCRGQPQLGHVRAWLAKVLEHLIAEVCRIPVERLVIIAEAGRWS